VCSSQPSSQKCVSEGKISYYKSATLKGFFSNKAS
jgi:hypothetical protein